MRHYINLTNGLEALAEVQATGEPWAFLRMRSTTLEHADWPRLISEVSDDLLMHLALGEACTVHDRGTRRALSKTIYQGVPLVRYLLNRRWHGLRPRSVALTGGGGGPAYDGVDWFETIYEGLFERAEGDRGQTKRRMDYYRRYVRGSAVHLIGSSASTEHDGDGAYYAGLTEGRT